MSDVEKVRDYYIRSTDLIPSSRRDRKKLRQA